jgi:hypothetical protein
MTPTEQPNPLGALAILKSRLYDILAYKGKLSPISRIGILTPLESAMLTAMTTAADQFQEDLAMEMAEAALDGLALTLLAVHDKGLPNSEFKNVNLQKLATILHKAGGHETSL